MPVTAAPAAAPMMALSEIGVSITRVGPELLVEPAGDAEHPAHLADRAACRLAAGDVLAQDDHIRVAAHFLAQRFVDRLAV